MRKHSTGLLLHNIHLYPSNFKDGLEWEGKKKLYLLIS